MLGKDVLEPSRSPGGIRMSFRAMVLSKTIAPEEVEGNLGADPDRLVPPVHRSQAAPMVIEPARSDAP